MQGGIVTVHCDNCGQTVLPTDTVCWHCGQELQPGPSNAVEKPSKPNADGEKEAISLTAVSVFAFLTLITIILFILVTNALANAT